MQYTSGCYPQRDGMRADSAEMRRLPTRRLGERWLRAHLGNKIWRWSTTKGTVLKKTAKANPVTGAELPSARSLDRTAGPRLSDLYGAAQLRNNERPGRVSWPLHRRSDEDPHSLVRRVRLQGSPRVDEASSYRGWEPSIASGRGPMLMRSGREWSSSVPRNG